MPFSTTIGKPVIKDGKLIITATTLQDGKPYHNHVDTQDDITPEDAKEHIKQLKRISGLAVPSKEPIINEDPASYALFSTGLALASVQAHLAAHHAIVKGA